ncbi:Uncharacterised protein [BD1-7 clade bacterium]|uniref:SnoaL-like domain-containing protein n=1 Tax=BD1-7 clade bacterium TaxID=2029982 RepID=A0A5S9PH76_9GAMM|nr:Uncharacterised protein [BD1-7 clade bacterium]CAA0103488.1 Uncharacterised protein [BD1-7 clade bacterium]
MPPKALVRRCVDAFNARDTDKLSELYAHHQVANNPVIGKNSIVTMFATEFATADMVCIVENIVEDGEWAILEWRDSLDLSGCGFFRVVDDLILMQRGYWDKLCF